MKRNYLLYLSFSFLAVPVFFCILFRFFLPFSIGPIVFITWGLTLLLFPALFIWLTIGKYKKPSSKAICVTLSTISGWLLSVVYINFFVGLTWLFGLYDYGLM